MLYLLSESHFSIHTWPENGACAIDFYHCGETASVRLKKAEELLCDKFDQGFLSLSAYNTLVQGSETIEDKKLYLRIQLQFRSDST